MQLSVKDAAGLLQVSEKTIYRWIKHGTIPAYKLSEQYRFNRAELLEWATSQRIHISPEIFAEADASRLPLPTVSDALLAGGVFYRIGGTEKPSVLRAVVDTLRLPEEVDREFLFQVLLAREALGSTGVGDGIAIPHVRNPIVLHLPRPTITLCFLEHPVDFGSLDGNPVTTLFTLVSPSVRAHLHMLSRLSFILRDGAFRVSLSKQPSRDELMAALRMAEGHLPPPNNRNQPELKTSAVEVQR